MNEDIIKEEIAAQEANAEEGTLDVAGEDITTPEPADAVEKKVDYEALVREDILTLREKFSECGRSLTDIGDLKNPHRFAALRDLGLSAEEAYLATGGLKDAYDTRAHLGSAVPAATRGSAEIPRAEYEIARGLFSDMSDADIKKLYRKVTK